MGTVGAIRLSKSKWTLRGRTPPKFVLPVFLMVPFIPPFYAGLSCGNQGSQRYSRNAHCGVSTFRVQGDDAAATDTDCEDGSYVTITGRTTFGL